MAHTTKTPLLSKTWDLQLDVNGDVVMADYAEAVAQNVSNECRCFKNDLYFSADHGIDWFDDQLGLPLQTAITSSRLRRAAESVPDVQSVESVELNSIDNSERTLSGVIHITTNGGTNVRCEV